MNKSVLSASLMTALLVAWSAEVPALTEQQLEEQLEKYGERIERLQKRNKRTKRNIRKSDNKIDEYQERFTLNGFISAGAAVGDDENLTYEHRPADDATDFGDKVSFQADSFIGLQMGFKLDDDWSFTGQFVSTLGADATLDGEWAYLSYQLTDQVQLRGGRMRTPFYQLSEYLDVGFAYPWVRPPVEVYVVPFSAYNGFDVTYNTELPMGIYSSVNAFFGRGDTALGEGGSLDAQEFAGLSVSFNRGSFSFRLAATRAKTDGIFEAGSTLGTLDDTLQDINSIGLVGDDSVAQFYQAGFVFDNGRWLVMSEAVELVWEDQLVQGYAGQYLMVGHRFGRFLPYVTFANTYTTQDGDKLRREAVTDLREIQQNANDVATNLSATSDGYKIVADLSQGILDDEELSDLIQGLSNNQFGLPAGINALLLDAAQKAENPGDQATVAANLAAAQAGLNSVFQGVAFAVLEVDEEDNPVAAAEAKCAEPDERADSGCQLYVAAMSVTNENPDLTDLRLVSSTLAGNVSTVQEQAAAIPTAINSLSALTYEQKSWIVGVRYDISRRMAAKFEVLRGYDFNGTDGNFEAETGYQPDTAYVYSLVLDAVF